MDVRVEFEGLPWMAPAQGIRFKTVVRGTQQVRLLELSEGFEEREWCTQAHAFYVLEGEFSLRLRERTLRMKSGDVGLLESGEEHHHKAIVGRGGRARLLMFEFL